jgi:SAM-dependent methyltransferase
MTGFSTQWLSLRESADHRARHTGLCQELHQYFEKTQPALGKSELLPFRVTDLGCGSGSNLRALAEDFPAFQHWTLIDYDPALLKAARETLLKWADQVLPNDAYKGTDKDADLDTHAAIRFLKNGKNIIVRFMQVDLAKNIEHVLAGTTDLITAAAFYDLVSPEWITRFCQALHTPLFTVLTYDGTEKWTPAHFADESVLNAFHAHQTTDKGFGLSAGPGAVEMIRTQLSARKFHVRLEKSPWLLNVPKDQALMKALATGSAAAVAETKKVSTADLEAWLGARMQAQTCEIGHWDLFAIPS